VISGSEFGATIDGAAGGLTSYRWKGQELLAGPFAPHLWRVPTDNDEGGGTGSFAHRWREAGLDRARLRPKDVRALRLDAGRARITVESRVEATKGALLVTTEYEVRGNGEIGVVAAFRREGELPPLPRVGFQLQLPGSLAAVEWYGRGPQESYPDRKDGARLGVYRASVADLHFPYVMAQENGNHTDVRWLTLTDGAGHGLRFAGEPSLSFTAHDYTDAALLASKTSQEIVRDGRITLSLDLAQMGLGGDDSWSPRVHPEYRFAFRLRGIGREN
jgi:beta-galactosidase